MMFECAVRRLYRGFFFEVNSFLLKLLFVYYTFHYKKSRHLKINLASGNQIIPGYLSSDVFRGVDLRLDLSKSKLPFPSGSVDSIICTSGINYITYGEARLLIKEIHRVLNDGGVCRMSVQDLDLLIKYYYENNTDFFNQKSADGTERFPGFDIADKFNNWFSGFYANGHSCKYVYNYESLKHLFVDGGFRTVERKAYLESRLDNINLIDNRADQMFFLEAVK